MAQSQDKALLLCQDAVEPHHTRPQGDR